MATSRGEHLQSIRGGRDPREILRKYETAPLLAPSPLCEYLDAVKSLEISHSDEEGEDFRVVEPMFTSFQQREILATLKDLLEAYQAAERSLGKREETRSPTVDPYYEVFGTLLGSFLAQYPHGLPPFVTAHEVNSWEDRSKKVKEKAAQSALAIIADVIEKSDQETLKIEDLAEEVQRRFIVTNKKSPIRSFRWESCILESTRPTLAVLKCRMLVGDKIRPQYEEIPISLLLPQRYWFRSPFQKKMSEHLERFRLDGWDATVRIASALRNFESYLEEILKKGSLNGEGSLSLQRAGGMLPAVFREDFLRSCEGLKYLLPGQFQFFQTLFRDIENQEGGFFSRYRRQYPNDAPLSLELRHGVITFFVENEEQQQHLADFLQTSELRSGLCAFAADVPLEHFYPEQGDPSNFAFYAVAVARADLRKASLVDVVTRERFLVERIIEQRLWEDTWEKSTCLENSSGETFAGLAANEQQGVWEQYKSILLTRLRLGGGRYTVRDLPLPMTRLGEDDPLFTLAKTVNAFTDEQHVAFFLYSTGSFGKGSMTGTFFAHALMPVPLEDWPERLRDFSRECKARFDAIPEEVRRVMLGNFSNNVRRIVDPSLFFPFLKEIPFEIFAEDRVLVGKICEQLNKVERDIPIAFYQSWADFSLSRDIAKERWEGSIAASDIKVLYKWLKDLKEPQGATFPPVLSGPFLVNKETKNPGKVIVSGEQRVLFVALQKLGRSYAHIGQRYSGDQIDAALELFWQRTGGRKLILSGRFPQREIRPVVEDRSDIFHEFVRAVEEKLRDQNLSAIFSLTFQHYDGQLSVLLHVRSFRFADDQTGVIPDAYFSLMLFPKDFLAL